MGEERARSDTGIAYSLTQPMTMQIDESISGVKADFAIKVFGDDFRTLETLGQQALHVVSRIRENAELPLVSRASASPRWRWRLWCSVGLLDRFRRRTAVQAASLRAPKARP